MLKADCTPLGDSSAALIEFPGRSDLGPDPPPPNVPAAPQLTVKQRYWVERDYSGPVLIEYAPGMVTIGRPDGGTLVIFADGNFDAWRGEAGRPNLPTAPVSDEEWLKRTLTALRCLVKFGVNARRNRARIAELESENTRLVARWEFERAA